MLQYQIPPNEDVSSIPNPCGPCPFTPVRVTVAGQPYQYKRIDVTVTSGTGPLGIGARVARVTGFIGSPAPNAFLSVVDGCAIGAPAPCP